MGLPQEASQPTHAKALIKKRTFENTLCIVKSLYLLNRNVHAHSLHLQKVFVKDEKLLAWVKDWESRRLKTTSLLTAWIQCTEPACNLDLLFKRFTELGPFVNAHSIPSTTLLEFCTTEINTQCIYLLLASQTKEPHLKKICRQSAKVSEKNHEIFLPFLSAYLKKYPLSLFRRFAHTTCHLRSPFAHEMSCAYFTINTTPHAIYHPDFYSKACFARIWPYYSPQITRYMVRQLVRITGVQKHQIWRKLLTKLIGWTTARHTKIFFVHNQTL